MQKGLKPGNFEQLHAACGQGLDPVVDVEGPECGEVLGRAGVVTGDAVGPQSLLFSGCLGCLGYVWKSGELVLINVIGTICTSG